MKLGGGLPMVYRKVTCESRVEWTRQPWMTSSSLPESIIRFHCPPPSKVGMEFPRITPNVEAG